MSFTDTKMRGTVQDLLTGAGFSSEQATQMLDGLDITEELSRELGELSEQAVKKLNLISLPFVGTLALSPDSSSDEAYFSLLKDLLGEIMRAAYQLGGKNSISIWQSQSREENKDLPN